ncbi:hypothetical protein [Terricaulis sp.]|uniref:hypothetical protein n=1 Tax=Terricaulis sp. TaxID=2768686 RepID=UPI0037830A99
MSQAVIDFCEGLKATLLNLEDRLDKAQRSMAASASQAGGEASKHVAEAAEQLEMFKAHAGLMAQALRAEIPDRAATVREKLKDFGLEAQVAMRHAVILLAETAAKGAEGTAETLQVGAKKALEAADKLRRETAVSVKPEGETPPA